MFGSMRRGTVIAHGLKIVGNVTAEGLVEVNGQIEGELHCASLIIARKCPCGRVCRSRANNCERNR
jgi:cytoskeletal protein CcmA (bactofilin family)